MKILVCVSKTPDTTARIAFKDSNTVFDSNGVQFIMNPYDEWYALVRAVELVEAGGGSVTLINVGREDNDTILRKGLAIGADDAVRIDAEADSAFFVASQIAAYAKEQSFDLVLLGKETIDYNGSEVGSMLAQLLDMPFVSHASDMQVSGSEVTISREIEGGTEVLSAALPLVVSAAKGLAEQRIPNMKGIMGAKRKPLAVIPPVAVAGRTQTVAFSVPEAKGAVRMIDPDNMEELVRLLHEESKVI
jgi:electron transfer flavoprotein beta subunit